MSMKQERLDFRPEPAPRAIPVNPQFYGEGYVPALDQKRLSRHCAVVLRVLRNNRGWMTYAVLARTALLAYSTLVPEGSVRTRISNLRAWGYKIETRTRSDRFREVRLREKK